MYKYNSIAQMSFNSWILAYITYWQTVKFWNGCWYLLLLKALLLPDILSIGVTSPVKNIFSFQQLNTIDMNT